MASDKSHKQQLRVQLKPDAADPFILREGLSIDQIYEVEIDADAAWNDVYRINGNVYHASRFNVLPDVHPIFASILNSFRAGERQ
jgi:hypothetical protein